jgi:hydroxymethylglutaryl-CoA lyase
MKHITVYEVGPRDGLQNESATITTQDKIAFVDRLSEAHLPIIEVSAFVSPSWVPQMADAGEVFKGIRRRAGTRYTALVPNLKGLDRAQAVSVDEAAVFAAASETFSRRNINQSIDESLETYAAVDEVAISDTIGVAHPGQVRQVLDALLAHIPAARLALHFHDTRGVGLANVLAALSFDIHTFDASTGGLGGCPYAPGASGNVATEDVVYMLEGMGVRTGIDLDKLVDCARLASTLVGHEVPSKYYRAAIGARSRASSTG